MNVSWSALRCRIFAPSDAAKPLWSRSSPPWFAARGKTAVRKDGNMCNGGGTGHPVDESVSGPEARALANRLTLTRRIELQKRLPHRRIFRQMTIGPPDPVRSGYLELPSRHRSLVRPFSRLPRAGRVGAGGLTTPFSSIASELVTNAIKASGVDAARRRRRPPPRPPYRRWTAPSGSAVPSPGTTWSSRCGTPAGSRACLVTPDFDDTADAACGWSARRSGAGATAAR